MKREINFIGGNIIESMDFELGELIDDEVDQIIISTPLFQAFDNSSKFKLHYNKRKSRKLFKHVVYLYNDSVDTLRYRSINIS